MKVILTQDVVNLGEEGDVRVVKDGYARNYLLPTGAAVIYNKGNAAIFASRAAQIEKRKEEKRAEARSLKEKLDSLEIRIVVSAGESGKLFGSVTSQMVQEELKKAGFDIERKKIEVATHAIKMTGTYSVLVHLYEFGGEQVEDSVVRFLAGGTFRGLGIRRRALRLGTGRRARRGRDCRHSHGKRNRRLCQDVHVSSFAASVRASRAVRFKVFCARRYFLFRLFPFLPFAPSVRSSRAFLAAPHSFLPRFLFRAPSSAPCVRRAARRAPLAAAAAPFPKIVNS